MKKILFTIICVIVASLTMVLTSCASWERDLKSFKSDVAGGLERIIIVYDLTGEEMARYEGKIDLATEDGCVQFEYGGKRIIWYNAIVSVIEK